MTPQFRIDVVVPLDRFDLEVRHETGATSLGVFGPSGAGKSTLLETVAGLRPGARGRIEFLGATWLDTERGHRIPPEGRRVGYVPQDGLLFPHRDVIGNVLMGRRRLGGDLSRHPDPERVLEVLELAGLERRPVGTLSGGERQRVALGRALCSGPDLLLMDEPLASLDLPLRRRILPYLLRVREEFGVPTLHVSHDPTEVRLLCDEVVVLREGKVVAAGSPDRIFADPAVLPLAAAEGVENVLRGTVTGLSGSVATLEIESGLAITVPGDGLAPGSRAVATVRPEDLLLALEPPAGLSARNALPGGIVEIRSDASGRVWVLVAIGRRRSLLTAAISEDARQALDLRAGRAVHVVFKTHACRVFRAGGDEGL